MAADDLLRWWENLRLGAARVEVVLELTEERNDFSLLTWVDLLGAGFEEMERFALLF